ncbi:beta-1,4-glucuronosyltransferase WelK [Sphingobium sp. EM0848]|uniref:beta-1,4-glucuronosyltransferase WelK n=1 Tax=Sphingobium sp. EM0848 TaxID=2743473 RepID=UPI00159C63D2|nr:glycosyltransferase [Sphingobium sp. EM0848]
MAPPSLRICLAGSGGGHVRQLLDLEPFWAGSDCFFVTEDTALGQSIAANHDTCFVPHVALGQARLGAPFRMLRAAIRNMTRSAAIILRKRPDIIVTTGAGSVFFTILWGRLAGAKIVAIDSFARFTGPSTFARMVGPLAHIRIAQSAEAARQWGALCFDPFRLLEEKRPEKEALLFATVGATLPFDRLTQMVAQAKSNGDIPEKVLAQVGTGGIRPEGMETVETLSFDAMKQMLRDADIVVCHGGTGSLITALREGCRVIAVPRRFDRGEHYDDHQSEITRAFADRGLIAVIDRDEDFGATLNAVRAREPIAATTDPSELIAYLSKLVAGWESDSLEPAAKQAA